MAYYLNLECAVGYVWDAASGTLICSPAAANRIVGASPDFGTLTPAQIGLLLSLSLGVFALAWGFRVVGSLIFKSQ